MADARIVVTMNQTNVAVATGATLYVGSTDKRLEIREAAQAVTRWCLSVLEGIPPLEGWSIPTDKEDAIADALEGIRFEDANLDEARQWIIKAVRKAGVKPPKPVPGTPVLAPPLPHSTDFLAGGKETHPYVGYDEATRKGIRDAMVARRYRHLWIYAYNEQDYGGPKFDYLRNPQGFRPFLDEIRAAGLNPIVWLFPDDAPEIDKMTTAPLQALISGFVPVVDDLVGGYVLGLELDEYWDGNTVNALGNTLRGLTTKKLAAHMTPGKWDYGRQGWCDYFILQYGFGKDRTYIANMTKTCMAALNKPVVAGEYERSNEAAGIPLGDAAVAAGAQGFGNGGTAPAPITPPSEKPPAQALDSPNLLAGSVKPWRPGSLVAIAEGYRESLIAYCATLPPTTKLVLSDMDQIPPRMREAGFSGRDTALWYTLSRSYAGWDWPPFKPGDPDAHLTTQRQEIAKFWENYIDEILHAMRLHTHVTALFLLNDGHDKLGDVLSDYSLRQLAPVASRIERGHVHKE